MHKLLCVEYRKPGELLTTVDIATHSKTYNIGLTYTVSILKAYPSVPATSCVRTYIFPLNTRTTAQIHTNKTIKYIYYIYGAVYTQT